MKYLKRLAVIGLAALIVSAGIKTYNTYRIFDMQPAVAPAVVHVDEYKVSPPSQYEVHKIKTIDLSVLPYMKACTVMIQTKLGNTAGVIIDAEEGLVLSCVHGTPDRGSVRILMDNGQKFEVYQFQIRRFEKYDLALIRVGVKMGDYAAHIRKEPVRLGEEVIAIGSPAFAFNSLSFGRITGLDRKLLKGQSGYDWSAMRLIQTDAAINGGNSGGPLFDVQGRVVAINVTTNLRADGLSMSVPAEYILRILGETK